MCSLIYMLSVWGAPVTETPLPQEKAEPGRKADQRPQDEDPLAPFDVARPPQPKDDILLSKKKDISFYGYRQSFSALAGVIREETDLGFAGFQYLLPSESGSSWEAGIDVYNEGSGAFNFAYRHVFFHLEVFRPYWKAGGAFRSDGEGQLASLVRFDNFRAEGGAGCEYLLIPPFSLRLEAQLSIGKSSTATMYRAGLSWGWY